MDYEVTLTNCSNRDVQLQCEEQLEQPATTCHQCNYSQYVQESSGQVLEGNVRLQLRSYRPHQPQVQVQVQVQDAVWIYKGTTEAIFVVC